MRKVIKVRMSDYKGLKDDELSGFASTLLENGRSADFDAFRSQLTKLAEHASDFATKALKAKNNGKVEGEARDAAKEELLMTIDEYAYLINSAAVRDASIIAKSGFSSTEFSRTQSNVKSDLTPAHSLSVEYIKNTKNVKLTFVIDHPRRRDLYKYQWSEDNGVTWHEGDSGSRKEFIIKNLPLRKDLLLRVTIVAFDGKIANESATIGCFIA